MKSFLRGSILLAGVGMTSACAVSYGPYDPSMGGYVDNRLDEGVYFVAVRSGNVEDDVERELDFTLLRMAELTLGQGYEYFAAFDVEEDEEASSGLEREEVITSREDVSRTMVAVMYEREIDHVEHVFDARSVYKELMDEYQIRRARVQTSDGWQVVFPEPDRQPSNRAEFTINEQMRLSSKDPENVRVHFSLDLFTYDHFPVGMKVWREMPYEDLVTFRKEVKPKAAEHGANAVVIETQPDIIKERFEEAPKLESLRGFATILAYVPEVSLGVEWETGALRDGRYIVRRLESEALEAGTELQLQDAILEVEGLDVRDRPAVARLLQRHEVGDTLEMIVVRGGKEVHVEAVLIQNR